MKKQYTKAAKLWGDIIREGGSVNNGDGSLTGVLGASLMARTQEMAASKIDDLDAEIAKFEANLVELLEQEDNPRAHYTFLMCDYNPCTRLAKALEGTQIDESLLGIKTDMRITAHTVSISKGYGAPNKNYYVLEGDDRFLECWASLGGKELEEIVELVKNGTIKTMRIQ